MFTVQIRELDNIIVKSKQAGTMLDNFIFLEVERGNLGKLDPRK